MPLHSVSRRSFRDPGDDAADAEVPAAVVCASCGRGDCPGCGGAFGGESGVVAIVPWERGQGPWLSRLLDTAQATTSDAEVFFGALKDGAVEPALRFALLAESFAVGSTAMVVAPFVVLAIPGLLLRCLLYTSTRHAVTVATSVATVGITALLLGAHALHGLILRRQATRSHALRFAFYASGWDFGSSPAGFVGVAFRNGLKRGLGLVVASLRAPFVGTDAALATVFATPVAERAGIRRRAMLVTLAMVVPAILVLVVLIGALALTVP